jgi:uncharacterized tellurite resistance protein B-like protein
MLFSFIKNHKNQDAINEHLGSFQSLFSENQKKAIMVSLFLIANSDREFHEKEVQFFEYTASILNYKLHNDLNFIINEFRTLDRNELFRHLASLEESQKDWYIITVFGMLHADGKILKEEFQYVEVFFSKMNITEQRFEKVLKDYQLLME